MRRLGHIERPALILVPPEDLDPRLVLRDEHVLLQRGDAPVMGELLAAVVGFGAVREHLHQDYRVHDGVGVLWISLETSADDSAVGIGREPGRERPHPKMRWESPARQPP